MSAAVAVALLSLAGAGGDGAYTAETAAGTGKPALGLSAGAVTDVNIGQPFGVEIGPDGALYVTEVENHRVLRVDAAAGKVSVVAGNGRRGTSGDGGPAVMASLNEPYEVRFNRAGDLFVVEMRGAVVRRVDARSGTISTVAGSGASGFGGDGGPAARALFKEPHSIALDEEGALYIADIGNHRIRKVDLGTGRIDTVAGTGERKLPVDGAAAAGSPLLGPRALHVHGRDLWVALREGNSVWRIDLAAGTIHHVAGTGERGARDGPARQATFDGPKGIVRAPDGGVFIADTENQLIRRLDPVRSEVRAVAGAGPTARGFRGDGGPALEAWFDRPHGITTDAAGSIYVGDTGSHRVRRLRPAPRAPKAGP